MRAHAAVHDTDAALRCAEEAVADFAGSGERIELCRTLLAAAQVSLDAGRVRGVADWLDRAAYLAGQCGSARLAEDVAHRRRRLAATAHASDTSTPLTAREREIAALVAQGRSNRDIGRLLSIGDRTVQTHMANVLTKLGLASRTQAALWAVREGLVEP